MHHRGIDKSILWRGKYKCLTATVLLALLLLVGNAAASNLDTFLDKCGGCHKKGAEAAPVNPADKAGLVWKKYFKRNRHPVDLSGTINSEEQVKVIAFLENHAADSDHPVAAIIPK